MGLRDLLQNDLTTLNFNSDLSAVEPWASYHLDQTDIPRMREGRVGGQFWAAYFGCHTQHLDAVHQCLEQIDVIRRLVEMNPNDMSLVTDADGTY